MSAVEMFSGQLDGLKVITLTDGEVWSARDLIGFAGYARWEDFRKALDRAKASAESSRGDSSDHFRDAPKMVQLGSGAKRQIEDVELTRYGAYLLFMNGDPRKPEIAAAQQYFAVQTRRQELSTPQLPGTYLEALKALIVSEEAKQELEERVSEDAPKVEAFDQFIDAGDDYSLDEVAKMLGTGRNRLTTFLRDQKIFMLTDRPKPLQLFVERGYFRVVTRTNRKDYGPSVYDVTLVTPTGLEYVRKRLAAMNAAAVAS